MGAKRFAAGTAHVGAGRSFCTAILLLEPALAPPGRGRVHRLSWTREEVWHERLSLHGSPSGGHLFKVRVHLEMQMALHVRYITVTIS